MPNGTPDLPHTPGTPGSNGAPRRAPAASRMAPPARPPAPPAERGPLARLIHYASIGLIILFCLAVPISIPYLRRDPLVWDLTILFTGVTGAACGATAGITLVVFGGAHGRRWMLIAGVAVGVVSFVILGVTILWALNHNAPKPT